MEFTDITNTEMQTGMKKGRAPDIDEMRVGLVIGKSGISWTKTVTSTFASISLKYVNPVSIIFVIFVEFGVTSLYLLLKQYQQHLLAAALTIAIHY